MNRTACTYLNSFIVCFVLSLIITDIHASGNDPLDRVISIPRSRETVYNLLRNISKQSGFMFIYDSSIIDNNKKINIAKGEYSLRDAINLISENNNLQMDISGEYILLRQESTLLLKEEEAKESVSDNSITIKGVLTDITSKKPIMFASVSVTNTSTGTRTNQNGEFQLIIPDSLLQLKIKFYQVGYESREVDLSLLKNHYANITLVPHVIQLEEVVVVPVNPTSVLNDMIDNLSVNYASKPAYLTTFYREGISHNGRNIDLTESVLKVYKTGYKNSAMEDQIKLIKKRRIVNRNNDTIYPRMRSGINSCMILDIIKEFPDFLEPEGISNYKYSHKENSIIDGRRVDVISFEQKKDIYEPLYTGDLFIEIENKALSEVRFEVNPSLVNKATHAYVDKKNAGLKLDLQQAKYIISYKLSDDSLYYINHVRGDIMFKVKRKKRLFSPSLHFWFEMVTCDVSTENVSPFTRNERLSTTQIFADKKHEYDKNFWGNFNIILPEEHLKENIIKNLSEILIHEQ